MDYKDLRIVFMGTPPFAVASLEALVRTGFNIVGVVTAPDKPGGRGMALQQSAVKEYATKHGLPVLQPPRLKDPQFVSELQSLRADLQVVVAFRMLPEVVWSYPRLGTINLHGSLLPQYRGAAPINWAVINGEEETGVTTFKLQHEIDTGNILLQEKIGIGADETAGNLHDRMMLVGAELVVKTVKGLFDATLVETPQAQFSSSEAGTLQAAPKLFTDTCRIDWNLPAHKIFDLVRGLSPYPAAFTELEGKKLKILAAKVQTLAERGRPGTHTTDGKSYLCFATADGYLAVTDLQLEGKKRMTVADFLRGYRFKEAGSDAF
jgi:methionyl-tRNA formyltransferase